MRKTILAAITALATLAIGTGVARAVETGASVKVLELTAQREGVFYAKFSGNICNDAGLAQNIGQIVATDSAATADGIKMLFTALHSAKLAGSNVVVSTDGGGVWGCRIKWVTIK